MSCSNLANHRSKRRNVKSVDDIDVIRYATSHQGNINPSEENQPVRRITRESKLRILFTGYRTSGGTVDSLLPADKFTMKAWRGDSCLFQRMEEF